MRRGVEGDLVAEGLELGDGSLAGTVAVAADEEVAAKVGIVAVVGQQVPGNDQDRVADGDGRLLLADPAGEPPELGRQVGVAAAGRGPGALDQNVPEPEVAFGGPAGSALAAGDVVARAAARPGARWPAVGNTDMSTPPVGDEAFGGPLADPVMVSRRSRACANGAMTRSTAMSSSVMDRSSCSTWSRASCSSRAWWAA